MKPIGAPDLAPPGTIWGAISPDVLIAFDPTARISAPVARLDQGRTPRGLGGFGPD